MRSFPLVLLAAAVVAPIVDARSLADVVRRKRTNKAAELFTVDAEGQSLGAAADKDDASLNELWNEATELEFIDERLLQTSSSMSFPNRADLPSSDEGPLVSGDEPTPEPPSGDRPTPEPPSIDSPVAEPPDLSPIAEPTPSDPTNAPEPTTPPQPSEPTTPQEPTTPPAPTNPGECLEGTTKEDYLLNILSAVTDAALLQDPDTPQGEAFQFMVDDTIDVCTYPTLEQRYGLSVFYFSTEGDDWLENEGWVQSGVNECEWFNVTCGGPDSEIVVAIQLESNGLDGPLPEEISTLDAAETLLFFDNDLSSSIPDGIGSLTALKLLDLEQNLLTGQFFTEAILSLSEIVALRASFNDLNGTIPEDIDRLSKVEQLWIAENQFNGALPTQLGNLQSLDSLFLYNNTFDGPIISEFGTLANLTQLRLYGNVLNGEIPEELYDATRLRVLRVDLNFLQGGLSTSIGKLVELEDFRMNDQFPPGFTGSVPAELSQCSLLRNLLLNNNGFSGAFPDVFSDYTRLEFLDVSNNDFTDEIPSGVFLVSTLQVAYFSNNTFTGPIPTTYATPPDLRDLYFDGNELSGPIPAIPSNTFTNLTELLFERNNLTGEMPESICALRANETGEAVLMALGSDCAGDPPEVICDFPDCCNRCFS